MASFNSGPNLVDWLRLHGFNPSDPRKTTLIEKYNRQLTPMAKACESGNILICMQLFGTSAQQDITTFDSRGISPICYAAMGGHLDICIWLYNVGAVDDLTKTDDHGQTPLHWSCANGRLEVVKWIIIALPPISSYDVNFRHICKMTRTKQTPLYLACINGHVDVACWLIAHGAIHAPIVSPTRHIIWEFDQVAVIRDIISTVSEPLIYAWCSMLLNLNSNFFLFLISIKTADKRQQRFNHNRNEATEGHQLSLRVVSSHSDVMSDWNDSVVGECKLDVLNGVPKNILLAIADYCGVPMGSALKDSRRLIQLIHQD